MRTGCIGLAPLALAGLLLASVRTFGDEKPRDKTAEELAKEFVYPGAEKLGDALEGARMVQAKFTSTADANRVAAWYGKTLGFQGREGIAFNPGQQPGIRLSVADDSRQPGKNERTVGEARSVTLHVLIKKTNDFIVVAVVSRGKDENQTHVVLTFMDNKDQ